MPCLKFIDKFQFNRSAIKDLAIGQCKKIHTNFTYWEFPPTFFFLLPRSQLIPPLQTLNPTPTSCSILESAETMAWMQHTATGSRTVNLSSNPARTLERGTEQAILIYPKVTKQDTSLDENSSQNLDTVYSWQGSRLSTHGLSYIIDSGHLVKFPS